jgi:hypothetical protein
MVGLIFSMQLSYSEVELHLWNNFNTTRRWLYEANKANVDLQAQLLHERTLHQERQATLNREIYSLQSQLAAGESNKCGGQEMEERQTQTSRWLVQGAHTPQTDDTVALRQTLEEAVKERCSSAESLGSRAPAQQLKEIGPKRAKRTRRNVL